MQPAEASPVAAQGWMDAAAAARQHWPEYLMEAGQLGIFMVSACTFGALLFLPSSPVVHTIPNPMVRQILMGLAMAGTLVALIHSPWGKQSGAHLNPALSFTFFRLKKIKIWDACFYAISQFAGGLAGVLAAGLLIGRSQLADPAVHYVVTVPGPRGPLAAFIAELVMAFVLMTAVLFTSNHRTLSRYTGYSAGLLVATYITLATPISGMSINPARTTASAIPAHFYQAIWIYFTAPPLGMLAAAELYLLSKGHNKVFCAKLHHHNDKRCIFNCRFAEMQGGQVLPQTNNSL